MKGKQAALLSELDRRPVDVAASYMADEDSGIGFIYSGLCQAALPHKRLTNTTAWQITSDHITLIVDPGSKPGPNNTPEPVGVPYGSRARLIMLYLQSEAIRTRSRQVHLGRQHARLAQKNGRPDRRQEHADDPRSGGTD